MKTLLDRNVVALPPNPEHSASRKRGLESAMERLHLLHGSSLIYDGCQLLRVEASTFATACQLFHLFFHQRSLFEYDVWSTSLASILLATKIEDEPRSLKSVIKSFSHIYRKRLIIADLDHDQASSIRKLPFVSGIDTFSGLSSSEKRSLLNALPNQFFGLVFEEWHKKIASMEQTLLRQLGFT
jgi:hypothetical protein